MNAGDTTYVAGTKRQEVCSEAGPAAWVNDEAVFTSREQPFRTAKSASHVHLLKMFVLASCRKQGQQY